MQYAELKNSILKARQQRWDNLMMLTETCTNGCIAAITGNAPGAVKDSPALRELIGHAEKGMAKSAQALTIGSYGDAAGYVVFMHCPLSIKEAKEIAVVIETAHEWNRLLDIDIYGAQGAAADRRSMGLAPRKCLLCGEPAADCIRIQKHDYCDIVRETERLLRGFQRFCTGTC